MVQRGVSAGCGKKIKDGGLKLGRALITPLWVPFLFLFYHTDIPVWYIPGYKSAVSWELSIQTLSRSSLFSFMKSAIGHKAEGLTNLEISDVGWIGI